VPSRRGSSTYAESSVIEGERRPVHPAERLDMFGACRTVNLDFMFFSPFVRWHRTIHLPHPFRYFRI
jgi:hypothetical protein